MSPLVTVFCIARALTQIFDNLDPYDGREKDHNQRRPTDSGFFQVSTA